MKTLPLLLFLVLLGCAKDPFLTDDNGIFKDSRDKHEYKWVRIGQQIWMAENLAYLPSVNPSSNGSNTDPYYYVYGYEGSSVDSARTTSNYTTYGVLYNWEAAITACPKGWQLPNNAEWTILDEFSGALSGKKMKATSGWDYNKNGDNSIGFTGFPGGFRDNNGGFGDLGNAASFWSSSEHDHLVAFALGLSSDEVGLTNSLRSYGHSVRCIKTKDQ